MQRIKVMRTTPPEKNRSALSSAFHLPEKYFLRAENCFLFAEIFYAITEKTENDA